jgi:hypothetical protein
MSILKNFFVVTDSSKRCQDIQHKDTQQNGIQYNNTQHREVICDTQHKELICDTQHKELICDTQHKELICDTQHKELICDTQHK